MNDSIPKQEAAKALEMKIIHKIPDFKAGMRKRSKRQIQELMHEYDYDQDFIDTVSDEFCRGFGTAREIILELIKDDLNKEKETERL